MVIECLLFYHPAVGWPSGRLRAEREFCCDDLAVRVSGNAFCYVRTLSALDEMRDADLSLAMASNGGSLMNRITRLVGAPASRPRRTIGWLAPAVLAMTMTASASALTLSLPVDPCQEPGVKSDTQGKQGKQDKQKGKNAEAEKKRAPKQAKAAKKASAKNAKREALIRKLRAEGLSEVEIERYLARTSAKAKASRKQNYESRWKEKRAARIAEMRAKGMSEEEIKRALRERQLKEEDAALDRRRHAELKQKKLLQERIEKLRAAGLSEEEIEVAVKTMMVEERAAERKRRDVARAREREAQRETQIREMQKAGMSPDQIREALKKQAQRRKQGTKNKELEWYRTLEHRVAELKARGASEAEVKEYIAEWKREHAVKQAQRDKPAADKSRADRLRARRLEMIQELRAKGMSEEKIQRHLEEWYKKMELKRRDVEKNKKLELEKETLELEKKK